MLYPAFASNIDGGSGGLLRKMPTEYVRYHSSFPNCIRITNPAPVGAGGFHFARRSWEVVSSNQTGRERACETNNQDKHTQTHDTDAGAEFRAQPRLRPRRVAAAQRETQCARGRHKIHERLLFMRCLSRVCSIARPLISVDMREREREGRNLFASSWNFLCTTHAQYIHAYICSHFSGKHVR